MRRAFQFLMLCLLITSLFATSHKTVAQSQPPTTNSAYHLLVTQSLANTIALVDPQIGVIKTLEVGSAPWGIALDSDNRAFVSTAEGIAVVDVNAWQLITLVSYHTPVRANQFGEYRQGGMGITISPDQQMVYVGVYTGSRADQLEVLNTNTLEIVASVPIGVRPFDVGMMPDGGHVISIDHDSYSATLIDTATLQPITVQLAPLGSAAFDKPHYAAVSENGHLWLPYQGRILLDFDPLSGKYNTFNLNASTHQHGVAFSPDQSQLLIVGTGAAGEVSNDPSLTLINMKTMQETIMPLTRAHEKVLVSPDGQQAFLSGGYLLDGGWDGITVMDLQSFATREIAVADAPLDMAIILVQP